MISPNSIRSVAVFGRFPSMEGTSIAGWSMESPIRMKDLGVPAFCETSNIKILWAVGGNLCWANTERGGFIHNPRRRILMCF